MTLSLLTSAFICVICGLLPVDFDFGEASGASFSEGVDAEGLEFAGRFDGKELPKLVVVGAGSKDGGAVVLVAYGTSKDLEGVAEFGLFGGAVVGGDEADGGGFFKINGKAGSPMGVVVGPGGCEVLADAIAETVDHQLWVYLWCAEGTISVEGIGVWPPYA